MKEKGQALWLWRDARFRTNKPTSVDASHVYLEFIEGYEIQICGFSDAFLRLPGSCLSNSHGDTNKTYVRVRVVRCHKTLLLFRSLIFSLESKSLIQ